MTISPAYQPINISFTRGQVSNKDASLIPHTAPSELTNFVLDKYACPSKTEGIIKYNSTEIGTVHPVRGAITFIGEDGAEYCIIACNNTLLWSSGGGTFTVVKYATENVAVAIDTANYDFEFVLFPKTVSTTLQWMVYVVTDDYPISNTANGTANKYCTISRALRLEISSGVIIAKNIYYDSDSSRTAGADDIEVGQGAAEYGWPQQGKYPVSIFDRIFVFNYVQGTNNYFFSEAQNAEDWTPTTVSVNTGGGKIPDPFTGAIAYGSSILAFTRRGIMNLYCSAGSPTNWKEVWLNTNIGCIAHRTIVKHSDGLVYFVSEKGIARTDGRMVEYCDTDITDQISTLAQLANRKYGWTQSSTADWDAGTKGSKQLDTASGQLKQLAQTTQADWDAGTKASVETTSTAGDVKLDFTAFGKYQTAVVFGGQIYISSDYGATWTAKDSNRDWRSVSVSASGQYQTAVGDNTYIYISTDYGATWTAKDSVRSWMSVSVSASGQYQTAVGDGEQIYISTDYGATWTAKDSVRDWRSVSVSASGQYQTAVVYGTRIYISWDVGVTWGAVGITGQNWNYVSVSASGQYQTASTYGGKLYVSSDYGASWTAKDSNSNWKSVSVSASGQYQTAVVYGTYIFVSTDYGATWNYKDTLRNWQSVSVSASGQYQTAVVFGGQIYISADYGATWTAKDSNRDWDGISISKFYCGNIITQTIDYGVAPTSYGNLTIQITIPTNCFIEFLAETRATDSGWGSYTTLGSGSSSGNLTIPLTSLTKRQYLRIQAILKNNSSSSDTPILHSINVGGQYITVTKDLTTTPASWGTFEAYHTLNSQTISYAMDTSTNGSSWDGWTAVTAGSIPTTTLRRYIRYRITFNTTNYTQIPVLDSFTQNYFLTSNVPPPCGYSDNDRLYYSFTSNSATYNDHAWIGHTKPVVGLEYTPSPYLGVAYPLWSKCNFIKANVFIKFQSLLSYGYTAEGYLHQISGSLNDGAAFTSTLISGAFTIEDVQGIWRFLYPRYQADQDFSLYFRTRSGRSAWSDWSSAITITSSPYFVRGDKVTLPGNVIGDFIQFKLETTVTDVNLQLQGFNLFYDTKALGR